MFSRFECALSDTFVSERWGESEVPKGRGSPLLYVGPNLPVLGLIVLGRGEDPCDRSLVQN